MTYAIVGSGNIGKAIATQFARQGIDVLIANSGPPEALAALTDELGPAVKAVALADALRADIVLLAVPFGAIPDATSGGAPWNGRIVVDASNAIDFPGFTPTDLGGRPSSRVVADAVPGARLVKAFNTLPAAVLTAEPAEHGGQRVLWVSGDDSVANQAVAALITALGFFPIVLGALDAGGLLQQFAGPLTVHSLSKY